jgi:phage tail-like protein
MADRVDPYRAARFLLEIDGITQAGFSEAAIPDTTQDPIEDRDGNEPPTVRKLQNLIKYGNVTLKWGVTDSVDVYNWRKQVEAGKMGEARRNVAVILLDEEGNTKARWEFVNAWPTKYDAPDLNATGSDVSIETLEICHEGMQRVS